MADQQPDLRVSAAHLQDLAQAIAGAISPFAPGGPSAAVQRLGEPSPCGGSALTSAQELAQAIDTDTDNVNAVIGAIYTSLNATVTALQAAPDAFATTDAAVAALVAQAGGPS